MPTLDDKRLDWLYDHFQAISHAADRYLAAFGFVVTFALLMVLAPKDVFTVPILDLTVASDILLAGLCTLGAFLFIAYSGNFDKGEATLEMMAADLKCDYNDLWFVDTHPTIVDFAQYNRHADKRMFADRLISAMLYPTLLGLGLLWLSLLPGIRYFAGPLRGIHYGLYAIALTCLYFAWRRAYVFIERRWRSFKSAEASRPSAA